MIGKGSDNVCDEVDAEKCLLPGWLNGSEDFAEVMRENADKILASLD